MSALSSFDGSYNSLRDVQKTSSYDYMNKLSMYNPAKQPKNSRYMVDTKTYLQQIEEKYNQSKKQNESEYGQAKSHVPSKFNKLQNSRFTQLQPEFHLPQDLSLSRGPSEINYNTRVIQDMQERYLSNQPSVLSQNQDGKKRFFELVIEQKKKLQPSHPAQNLLIASLYRECQQLQIPEHQWNNWISQRLQQ